MPAPGADYATQAGDAALQAVAPPALLPELPRQAGIEGQVTVAVALGGSGQADSVWLLKSSGNQSLDLSALEAARGTSIQQRVIARWRRELVAAITYRFILKNEELLYHEGRWFAHGRPTGTCPTEEPNR